MQPMRFVVMYSIRALDTSMSWRTTSFASIWITRERLINIRIIDIGIVIGVNDEWICSYPFASAKASVWKEQLVHLFFGWSAPCPGI